MLGTIAITDEGWYTFLEKQRHVTELNFWTPSARRSFRAPEFSPFLFKLRAPHNAICGFAYFAQFSTLPDWLAWESFQLGNGCASFEAMHRRIARILLSAWSMDPSAHRLASPHPDPVKYDLSIGEGKRVWDACLAQAAVFSAHTEIGTLTVTTETGPRYGDPRLVRPRLGQATFRIAVLDAYGRACAVTSEHSLPALEAAHIRSYAHEGPHEIRNGLLLRADLHRLFDTGYITVTPQLRLEVGRRLRDDYRNGRSYYPLHGAPVQVPAVPFHQPDRAFLQWHNEHRFRG